MVKLVAAYLLAALGGNASPSAADIKKILNSVGIEADEARLATLLKEMKGKNIDEVVAEGQSKLASVPSGGAAAAPAAGGVAAAGGAAPADEKKEEVEEEEEDLGFDLFD